MKVALSSIPAGLRASAILNVEHLDVGQNYIPQVFRKALMASSYSREILFSVGDGEMDATTQVRALMQHAGANGQSFAAVAESYQHLLFAVGTTPAILNPIIEFILGSSAQIAKNRLQCVLPGVVLEQIKKALPDSPAIYQYLLMDFLIDKLSPLGLIMHDAPLTLALRPTQLFPRFDQLVDALAASNLLITLRKMQSTRLDVLSDYIRNSGAIQARMITSQLCSIIIEASDLARGAYDPMAMAISTLTAIGRLWDPETPAEMVPSERLQRNEFFAEFRSNYGFFAMWQDFMRNSSEHAKISYTDAEMVEVVFPAVAQAFADLTPYTTRIISDTVGTYTKKSVLDDRSRPVVSAIFENVDFTTDVSAFRPIRHHPRSGLRFLYPETIVSNSLTHALAPVQQTMSLSAVAESRLTSISMLPPADRQPVEGVMVWFGLPSVVRLAERMGVPASTLMQGLRSGSIATVFDATHVEGMEGEQRATLEREFANAISDYRSVVTLLAIEHSDQIGVSVMEIEGRRVPYLVFDQRVDFGVPLGDSAIINGRVSTTEPVEALAYSGDFQASHRFEVNPIPIASDRFKSTLHGWDWDRASVSLAFKGAFPITIRRQEYVIQIEEYEFLNLHYPRPEVRFMRPSAAIASCAVWLDWLKDDLQFIDDQIASRTPGDAIYNGLMGRKHMMALGLAKLLIAIGQNGCGGRASSIVLRKLRDSLYASKAIDEYVAFTHNAEMVRLHLWAGLTTLQMFEMITAEETDRLQRVISESNALSYIVSVESFVSKASADFA